MLENGVSRLAARVAALLALMLALAAGAPAAQAAAPTPAALKAVGISVSWTPGQTPIVAPGAKYAIRVSSARARRGAAVKIRAVRVGSGTVTSKVLVAKAVKRGLVRIPFGTDEARFIISVKGGGVSLRTVVRLSATEKPTPVPKTAVGAEAVTPTPAPAPKTKTAPTPTPAPVTTPPAAVPDPCKAAAPARATMTLGAATVMPGATLPYTVKNTGAGCLTGGPAYTLEERVESYWFPVDLPYAFPAIAVLLQSGATYDGGIVVPADTLSGHFRATTKWSDLAVSAEFDVVMPAEK